MSDTPNTRMIDRWFPVAAVDEACGTPAGSGLTEKAIFTWFASRPIAQARAAALTSLLPPDQTLKPHIEAAILHADRDSTERLTKQILATYGGKAPIVMDIFSGRGIIPLESGRAGASAIGIDLSPVATLAGRILATYPVRDWSSEPPLPFSSSSIQADSPDLLTSNEERLVFDVESVLAEVGRRVAKRAEQFYPRNERGQFPWGYIWCITIPCDGCKRRFPLLGSLVLRLPDPKKADPGQSIRLIIEGDSWRVQVLNEQPIQNPTYASGVKADGKKKKGKTARCIFCGHVHPLETVKSKGFAKEYEDCMIAVADFDSDGKQFFRLPTEIEVLASNSVKVHVDYGWAYSAVPDESIPPGNVHTVMASGYGYSTFGDLMVRRQTRLFIETAETIREVVRDMALAGIGDEYQKALASYAASNLCRQLRRSTRGAVLGIHRNGVDHVFQNECCVSFSVDSLEVGPGQGSGSWSSVSKSSVRALRKVVRERHGAPCRFRRASATALPRRDRSVDVIITDPPYYDMVEYADASDFFHVWLKRVLFDIEPELFGPDAQQTDGLQDKNLEIIVRRVHEPNRVKHDKEFYESMLAQSFREARRVLKLDGHLVVVFGHSDPDAWRRLLGALQTAGFVVTSAWPSRTESGDTGVASIKVTVTIGCRVASVQRPLGMASEVDREVVDAVMERVGLWEADGLALEDQLMASYGPAMEVYGRYARVINPDGSDADLDRYLTISRRAVRDAMRLRVDELPLETFDAITRFAIFWLRAKGRADVPKGEARFFVQADELHLTDLRDRILAESKAGFRLRLDDPGAVTPTSSVFEVVRSMAHVLETGGTEAVAAVIASAGREANDQQLWAVVADLANHLPASDRTAQALAGIMRTSSTISRLAASVREVQIQSGLFDEVKEE